MKICGGGIGSLLKLLHNVALKKKLFYDALDLLNYFYFLIVTLYVLFFWDQGLICFVYCS